QRGRQVAATVPDGGGRDSMMEYKGYIGRVEFDDESALFTGEVINTRDVITFQGESVGELTQAFCDSIDDYLAFCKTRGDAPDKPFSGQFVTRISPELHRQVNLAAARSGKSLNAWVAEQLQGAVSPVEATRVGRGGTIARKTAKRRKVVRKPHRSG